MKNKALFITISIAVLFVIIIFVVRSISGEDSWVCQKGQWIKHGNPSSSQPITGCPTDVKNTQQDLNSNTAPINQKELNEKLSPAKALQPITVEVYFGNSKKNNKQDDCSLVHPVTRSTKNQDYFASYTDNLNYAVALQALVQGPTNQEKADGYTTSFNSGVKVNKLSLEGNKMIVDFSSELLKNFGGSCRVQNITSQIEKTLKQFSEVKEVEITVNGKKDQIQP